MTIKETISPEFDKEFKKFIGLEELLGRIDYAILGQEPQMRAEMLRLRNATIDKIRTQRNVLKDIATRTKTLV